MTARTNYGAASAYVKKYKSELEGQDVNVVAFLQLAKELDTTTSGALLAEYRRFHALLEAHRQQTAGPVEELEDDLLSPAAGNG